MIISIEKKTIFNKKMSTIEHVSIYLAYIYFRKKQFLTKPTMIIC
jgi:hypothetical protein